MQLLGHHSVSYACLPAALPKSIGQLVALVTLDVSNNRITCKPAKPMLYTGSVCLTPHLCMFPTQPCQTPWASFILFGTFTWTGMSSKVSQGGC